MYSATKNDVKKLAKQIEDLAREVIARVDNNGDVMPVANELVRNSSTFTFALGEVYAVEQLGKAVVSSTVTAVKSKNANYHNVRDSLGRFKRV